MRRALVLVGLTACSADIDPQWQLDHERIIVVRAIPPAIGSFEDARLDMLIGHSGAPTSQQAPELATVVSPQSLAGVLVKDQGEWKVTGPDPQKLAAARAELHLMPDAPVPLIVGVTAGSLAATKTIYLGQHGENPTFSGLLIGGAAPGTDLVIDPLVDLTLEVEADAALDDINWLTSCGTMHDFDLPKARISIEKDDPTEGEVAIVLRTPFGGVAWQVWPIHE